MNYTHYIITRFNYPNDYPYLSERFDIFNKFTKPSLEAQTNKNFIWLIITNPNHISLFSKFNQINVKVIPSIEPYPSWSVVYSTINKNPLTEYIISTRICNDDAIHKDFVKSIQNEFLLNPTSRILDSKGYRYLIDTKILYTQDKYNQNFPTPFCSLVYKNNYKLISANYKDQSLPSLIMEKAHDTLHKFYPVTIFTEQRMWCQTIHGYNKLMKGEGNEIVELSKLKDFNIKL